MKQASTTERAPSILFFTVHKAASMFIYKICRDLARECGMRFYSVNHPKLSRYYFDTEESDLEDMATWGNRTGCFAPLRYYFRIPEPLNERIILHLRDPRDVLVSLFFSEAYSHNVFKGVFDLNQSERERIVSRGIDHYVLEHAETFDRKYTAYREILARPNSTFVKYEDLVLDFPTWLEQVAQAFSIDSRRFKDRIRKKYQGEFAVKKEDIHSHKRKIVPGDFREKLGAGTIGKLNELFAENLERYGYDI